MLKNQQELIFYIENSEIYNSQYLFHIYEKSYYPEKQMFFHTIVSHIYQL